MMLAVGKYLPVLSTYMANFADKAQRFVAESPDLMNKMMGSE